MALHSSQRAYWINIAREFPGTSVWVIVFDTPYEVSWPFHQLSIRGSDTVVISAGMREEAWSESESSLVSSVQVLI